MKTQDYAVDKSTWGDGPWQSEPDRVDFISNGFACLALRHPTHGHFCGYVGVPREHPMYGKSYNDVNLDFHGGLTYASPCRDNICHTPEPGMPDDVWWFGGDFHHCFDLAPGMEARLRQAATELRAAGAEDQARAIERPSAMGIEEYRALPFVRANIESLAHQLRAIADGAAGQ